MAFTMLPTSFWLPMSRQQVVPVLIISMPARRAPIYSASVSNAAKKGLVQLKTQGRVESPSGNNPRLSCSDRCRWASTKPGIANRFFPDITLSKLRAPY